MEIFMFFMVAIIVVVIIVVVVLYLLFNPTEEKFEYVYKKINDFPYNLRDDFLSDAEKSFYHTLKVYLEERAVVCPKVSLKDMFFVSNKSNKDYMKYFNKIAKKHVDFLLCEPKTMKPLCGIELDDSSHSRQNRIDRDLFVDKVFENAKLRIIHIPNKKGYTKEDLNAVLQIFTMQNNETKIETVQIATENVNSEIKICPKCGANMVLRTTKKGENFGKQFYGCSNYPKCKEIINL